MIILLAIYAHYIVGKMNALHIVIKYAIQIVPHFSSFTINCKTFFDFFSKARYQNPIENDWLHWQKFSCNKNKINFRQFFLSFHCFGTYFVKSSKSKKRGWFWIFETFVYRFKRPTPFFTYNSNVNLFLFCFR